MHTCIEAARFHDFARKKASASISTFHSERQSQAAPTIVAAGLVALK
jgi:hypothetical protein